MDKGDQRFWKEIAGASFAVRLPVTVTEMADLFGCRTYNLIRKLMVLDIFASGDCTLSREEITRLADFISVSIDIDDNEGNVPDVTTMGPKIPPTLFGHCDLEKEESLDFVGSNSDCD
ncbi:MAG: hypothetical protein P1U89_01765 [Verrucomicrobiales bacterium]|nr:hypothetical protein [Verrucomicrobiales bacterium]